MFNEYFISIYTYFNRISQDFTICSMPGYSPHRRNSSHKQIKNTVDYARKLVVGNYSGFINQQQLTCETSTQAHTTPNMHKLIREHTRSDDSTNSNLYRQRSFHSTRFNSPRYNSPNLSLNSGRPDRNLPRRTSRNDLIRKSTFDNKSFLFSCLKLRKSKKWVYTCLTLLGIWLNLLIASIVIEILEKGRKDGNSTNDWWFLCIMSLHFVMLIVWLTGYILK